MEVLVLPSNQEDFKMSNTNNTSISLNEHLSAVLDDEAGAFEQTRVLDELTKNNSVELRQSLSSYSLIGESMRSANSADTPMPIGNSFLAGIHEQIDKDSGYNQVHIEDSKQSAANSSSWLRPVGGFALAASFAAIAVIGVQNLQESQQKTNSAQTEILAATQLKLKETNAVKSQLSLAAMKSATVVSAADMISTESKAVIAQVGKKKEVATDGYQPADSRTRVMLKQYVDSHMQFASNTTFVPSVRVISYSDF